MFHEALILCNGDLPDPSRLYPLVSTQTRVIAADGGANRALDAGIFPHIVIGDLDSVTDRTRERLPDAEFIHVQDQDRCDFEKALDYCIEHGYGSIAIAGVDGRRIDFTLSNFAVLWRYAARTDFRLIGQDWTGYLVHQTRVFHADPGTTVSLIPFSDCFGVTLEGLAYPLSGADWKLGQTGVSNRVERSPFRVGLDAGRILVILMAHPPA